MNDATQSTRPASPIARDLESRGVQTHQLGGATPTHVEIAKIESVYALIDANVRDLFERRCNLITQVGCTTLAAFQWVKWDMYTDETIVESMMRTIV